jgi:putative endonuclease
LLDRDGGGLNKQPHESLPLGPRGEDYTRRRLERQGWHFVTANWHCPWGELDIVMRDGSELVFVEVKTRRGDFAGRAEEGISRYKSRRLLRACESFVDKHPNFDGLIWRVDLVAITVNRSNEVIRFTHIRNAVVSG